MGPVKDKDYDELFPYASALGAILYLRLTRPDLMVAISILAKFMRNPSKAHWTAIKDVLRYVKGSRSRGLLLYVSSGLRRSNLERPVEVDPVGRLGLRHLPRHTPIACRIPDLP